MTWLTVAKKDFRDAVQSRALWALVAVFVIVSVLSSFAYVEAPELFGEPDGATFGGLLFFTAGIASLFVPIAAIVVCYKSVAGERELGSIKLLCSLPTTRADVFAGKVLGRAAVLGFGLGVGLIVGLGFGAVMLGALDVVAAITFLLVTLAFVAVYATIVVGLSATTGSTSRATTLALGFFVVFELLWDAVVLGILYVAGGFSMPNPATMPEWAFTVSQIPPSAAYFSSIVALLPDLASRANAEPAQAGTEASAAGGEPFFASPEIGFVVLACWLVLPLVVGYVRFDAADL
ncbi:ABC-type transport system involved in multi-copper enzyme maturation, permease component [Halovivax ruber XH-70]|uniref:ABC-type transport system involved in multi-copper enzyme maturation, permease component n=1 Tax=Halovivax ruber (strain DSM 18193 / JCM 13892 / XH-70) TaxID=797302 RepID=L0IDB9_HALRX|nr:ABC transporter permease subunit [Halovivax ruber]AGB17555.1 ABC-type transport system involved in multi-copper enzyme maturation, permease component [Halovivax ruber XH-70]